MNNPRPGTSHGAEPEQPQSSGDENIGPSDHDPGAAITAPEVPLTSEAVPAGSASPGAEPPDTTSSAAELSNGSPPEPDAGEVARAGVPTSGAMSVLAPLALYSVLRLVLVIGLTAVLMIFMPLIVALLFAIIVQLPLSWLLFAGPRRRVNEAIARTSHQRRTERSRLQSALRGDERFD